MVEARREVRVWVTVAARPGLSATRGIAVGTGFVGFIGWPGRPCQQVITCLSAVCYCCDSDATLSIFTIVAKLSLSTIDCFLLSK